MSFLVSGLCSLQGKAIASRLEAITIRLVAIAIRLEAISIMLEAIAIRGRPPQLGWRPLPSVVVVKRPSRGEMLKVSSPAAESAKASASIRYIASFQHGKIL